jgi:2C-methyl-D-erythritol 2,4-cyclodiphosphate synthase
MKMENPDISNLYSQLEAERQNLDKHKMICDELIAHPYTTPHLAANVLLNSTQKTSYRGVSSTITTHNVIFVVSGYYSDKFLVTELVLNR